MEPSELTTQCVEAFVDSCNKIAGAFDSEAVRSQVAACFNQIQEAVDSIQQIGLILPKPGKLYRHFSGKSYLVQAVTEDSLHGFDIKQAKVIYPNAIHSETQTILQVLEYEGKYLAVDENNQPILEILVIYSSVLNYRDVWARPLLNWISPHKSGKIRFTMYGN